MPWEEQTEVIFAGTPKQTGMSHVEPVYVATQLQTFVDTHNPFPEHVVLLGEERKPKQEKGLQLPSSPKP